jgi:hypothetical protein
MTDKPAAPKAAPAKAKAPENIPVLTALHSEAAAMYVDPPPVTLAHEPSVLREEVRGHARAPAAGSAQPAAAAAAGVARRDQQDMMTELRSMKGMIEERFGALAFMEKLQRQPAQARLTQKLLDCGFSPALMPAMALAFVSFGAMLGMRGLWGGPWLMEVKGFSRIETGNLLLLLAASLVIGPFLAGLVGRAVGRLVLLLATGHLLAAGFIVLLVLAGGGDAPWRDGLLLVGYGLSITYQVSHFALVQGRVTPDVAGRAWSAMTVFFFGGAAVMQAMMGLAAFWGGVAAALLFIAAALVLGVVAFLLLERRFVAAGRA